MSKENNQKPEELDPDQIEWMEKLGLNLQMILVPNKKRIKTADENPGVDPSQVQIVTKIESKNRIQIIHSDFVRATKEEINKLMKSQFEAARKSLLDKHFELVPFELKPPIDSSNNN